MTSTSSAASPRTYLNPVYRNSFPDPFVLKFEGEYFAYCTGFWKDGRVFGVLRSSDLVNWSEIGGAMERLDSDAPYYWAPEVTYSNGKFYLYYSVGNEILMEIRLAVSDRPKGGFVDQGIRLTFQDFAIDPHVFIDTDGQRYMFYATDFLDYEFIGTGTVIDKMLDWRTLEGNPRPVTRAKYDWQVYDPARKEKGGVRWHTVEGPFVLKRKGLYYEMFSGGNWQNTTYGVSFATADSLQWEDEWEQFSDGEKVLPILRTVPERIIGPGHNSVVRGPNNRELYCVYHRWTEGGRVLSIDRMDFAGPRMFVVGASDTPQPAPYQPEIQGGFDTASWRANGKWKLGSDEASCAVSDKSTISCAVPPDFLCEVCVSYNETVNGGTFGIILEGDGKPTFEFSVVPGRRQASAVWIEGRQTHEEVYALPEFEPGVVQPLRLEVFGNGARVGIGETEFPFEYSVEPNPKRLSLFASAASATFSGFELTPGFEELFEKESALHNHGWISKIGNANIEGGELMLSSGADYSVLMREGCWRDFEAAANLRSTDAVTAAAEFGLRLSGSRPISFGYRADTGLFIEENGPSHEITQSPNIKPTEFHQFRIVKRGGAAVFYLDATAVGILSAPETETGFEIFCRGGVAVEMVRVTCI